MIGIPCPLTQRRASSHAWPIVTAHPEHDAALFMYERRIEDRGIQRAGIAHHLPNPGHNHGHDHGEGRHDDEIGRDNVNADTDGAVTTVETAETHRPGTDWNGDNLGAATGEATESGAGEAEKGNLN